MLVKFLLRAGRWAIGSGWAWPTVILREESWGFGLTHSAFPLLRLCAFLVSRWLYKGIAKLFWKPKIKLLWRALILVSWWVVSKHVLGSWAVKPYYFRPGGLHRCQACVLWESRLPVAYQEGPSLVLGTELGEIMALGHSRGSAHAW